MLELLLNECPDHTYMKQTVKGVQISSRPLFGLYSTDLSVHPFLHIHHRRPQNAVHLFYIALYIPTMESSARSFSSHLLYTLSLLVLFPANLVAPSSKYLRNFRCESHSEWHSEEDHNCLVDAIRESELGPDTL